MVPLHLPVFVIGPADQLPLEPSDWEALAAVQRQSMESGQRLRMFRVPEGTSGPISTLIDSEVTSGRPFCDALVPGFPVDSLSLGIYEAQGFLPDSASGHPLASLRVEAIRYLDQVRLQDVQNEACWFYPTEDGSYLCWNNPRKIRLLPGHLPDRPPTEDHFDYRGDRLRLLWSLMADDEHLTCVGLTYNHKRIEWPVESEEPHAACTWTWFEVDSTQERAYREMDRHQLSLPEVEPTRSSRAS
jgi:hypothetical protein